MLASRRAPSATATRGRRRSACAASVRWMRSTSAHSRGGAIGGPRPKSRPSMRRGRAASRGPTCYRGGGESRADLWERGTEALATLLDSAPSTGGGVVVAVSHGDILAEALIPIALGGAAGAGVVGTEALATGLLTPKAADLRNTCVNVIDVCRTGAGGSRAVRINDVSHLTPTGSPLRRRFDLREPAAAKVQR